MSRERFWSPTAGRNRDRVRGGGRTDETAAAGVDPDSAPVQDGAIPVSFVSFKSAAMRLHGLGGTVVRAESCDGCASSTPSRHRLLPRGAHRNHLQCAVAARGSHSSGSRREYGTDLCRCAGLVGGILAEASEFLQSRHGKLDTPLRDEHLFSELGWAEKKQVAYWKPRIVGEVIFNFWD